LGELNFDGSARDDALALGQKLLPDDGLEEGALACVDVRLPVDWLPTTARTGRLTSQLRSDLRTIYCVGAGVPVVLR